MAVQGVHGKMFAASKPIIAAFRRAGGAILKDSGKFYKHRHASPLVGGRLVEHAFSDAAIEIGDFYAL